jgi:transcription elongation factor Elf1
MARLTGHAVTNRTRGFDMANTLLSRPVKCKHCKADSLSILHMRIERSGAETFCRTCSACGRYAPDGGAVWVGRDAVYSHLSQPEIDGLPVIRPDYSLRCAVCGARGVEEHHWAPQAMFDNPNEWPRDYLCKKHHDEWHLKVTPQLVGGFHD